MRWLTILCLAGVMIGAACSDDADTAASENLPALGVRSTLWPGPEIPTTPRSPEAMVSAFVADVVGIEPTQVRQSLELTTDDDIPWYEADVDGTTVQVQLARHHGGAVINAGRDSLIGWTIGRGPDTIHTRPPDGTATVDLYFRLGDDVHVARLPSSEEDVDPPSGFDSAISFVVVFRSVDGSLLALDGGVRD